MEVKTGEALQHFWGPEEPKARQVRGCRSREAAGQRQDVLAEHREGKDALQTRSSPAWPWLVWQEYPLVGEQPGESLPNHHTHTHTHAGG